MEYKYYVQEYAKKRAENILPVPNNYSLRGDFGPNFISDFTALTKILKKIYESVAENPDAYRCELYSLDQEVRGKGGFDNESNLSLDRIVKCLRIFCDCGEIKDNILKVNAEHFKKQIKKVKDYSAIIEKLKDFGFCFQETILDKNAKDFFVKYPKRPVIITVLKNYMDCWNDVLNDKYIKNEIKKFGYGWIAGYYDFYLFDYKATANPKELDTMQLVKDHCYTWEAERKNTFINFYKYSKKYSKICFFGNDYFIGKSRICTFHSDYMKMKLRNLNEYMHEIEKMPENLQECFSKNVRKCSGCGCLGNNPDTCKNRIYWKFKDTDYIGCSMQSFYFNVIKNEDIPQLFKLLEYEYKL